MAADPISNYQKALRDVESSRRKAEDLVTLINDASAKLQRDWERVSVTDVQVGFSPAQDVHVNGRTWPSAQQLAEALAGYRTAVLDAGNAYRQIPEGQRGVVTPPPEHRHS